jgi:hypothetical protein
MHEAWIALLESPSLLHLLGEAAPTIPEIGLFTVISLALALTGAVYSVVLAFRGSQKEFIDSACKDVPASLEYIKAMEPSGNENRRQAEIDCTGITKWAKWWRYFLQFPVIIFCVFITATSVLVLIHKDPFNLTYPWLWFRVAIFIIYIADVLTMVLAYISFRMIKHYDGRLSSAYTIAQQGEVQGMVVEQREDLPRPARATMPTKTKKKTPTETPSTTADTDEAKPFSG